MSDRWGTGRIEAFSDGVFSIAITLLVLDIRVPAREFDDLWAGIANQWPAYLAYATSFVTIGGIWMAHHSIFGRLRKVSPLVMRLNLLLLMGVSFLPFPTRLLAEAIRDTDAERAAVIFYGSVLLVISLIVDVLWRSIARDRSLVKPEISEREVAAITNAATPNLILYLGVIALAVVAPQAGAVGYLVIATVAVVRARGDSAPAAETSAPL